MTLDLAAFCARPRVADGAWATELRARGWPIESAVELANERQPDLVRNLARDYCLAGAEVLTTNTFSANRLMLQRRRVSADAAGLNRRGAEIARSAAAEFGADALPLVVGSIGPSGRILAVREADDVEIRANVAEQARALREGGVDALLFETYSELAELLPAVEAARDATGLPIIASLSFDSGPQRTRTMMGADAANCAAALTARGADLIGCNCGSGIADVLPAVVALRSNTDRPIWVKPNAGLPELEEGRLVYRRTPEEFAAIVPQLVEAGAGIIGGCCGTGPEHIRRIAEILAPRAAGAARPTGRVRGRRA